MKGFILVISVLLTLPLLGNDLLHKTNIRTYQINIETLVKHTGKGMSNTDLFLAHLTSNEYQGCYRTKVDQYAKIIQLGSTGDSCIYYDLALGGKLDLGKKVFLHNEFILEVADVSVDLSTIDSIYDYNLNDPNYINYTGSNHPFINIKQKRLLGISDLIWENSSDALDYVKNCYQYVAKTFKYGLPLTGFKSLEFTLKNKMGDCGNLNSVFITLLRMKGIPARHLMGFRPDRSLHVWADFYLANYGWIPVDITYQKDYPDGNYFGYIKFEDNGFIVQRGIGHEISALDKPVRITGLQTFMYQVSYSNQEKAKVLIDRKVSCVLKN